MGSSFKDAVDGVNKAYTKAYNSKDAAGVAALYTEDICLVQSDGKVRKGRKALIEALNEAFKANSKYTGYEVLKAAADGNVGYSVQTATFSEGPLYVITGYKRDASGSWLTADEGAITLPP